MAGEALKVGDVAKRTGLTVRTLHHYDEIGLLKPSHHTDAGYRLYTAEELGRLQQVMSLRQLGFGLDEVRELLDRKAFSPGEVVRLHLTRAKEQIALQRRLCERLEALADHFDTAEEVTADQFLRTIEVMTMTDKYYTPEQLDYLTKRREQGGAAMEQRIQQAPQLWDSLHADVRAEIAAGTDPSHPRARALAERWLDLITQFTGGDPGIFRSLKTMYQSEDNVRGMDVKAMRPLNEYLQKAADAAGIKHPGQ